MKKLYTIVSILLLAATFTNAQSIFYEDFESGVPGQFTQEYIFGTTNWLGSTAGMTLGGSDPVFEGDSSAHMYGTNTEERTGLITPSLDMSASGYKLGFAHTQGNWAGDQNTLTIHYSGDDGTTWTLIDSIVDNVPNYIEVEYNLDDYVTTTATSKIRFTGYVTFGYAIGLDVVNVFLPAADDAELTNAVEPANGCGLGSETVAIEVFNNGLNTILSIDATYEVGNESESETFTVNIAAGETDTLYFSVPADLSVVGIYDFTSWIELTGDLDLTNDTITFSVSSIPVVGSLPYNEGFESGDGGWIAGGTSSTWELGAPSNSLINQANNGSNAWVTNLTGDYVANELSFVESPCFDFSALSVDPVFRFAHIFDTENCCDEGYVDISFDAGTTWNRLGASGEGQNWYDDAFNNEWDGTGSTSGGTEWRTAEHLLDGASGESSVKLRIFFSSDGSGQNEGFGFDDISIFEFPAINAGVTEVLSPVNGCGLGSETVTVVIENFGLDSIFDFNVEYNAGAGVITQLVTDTLYASEIDTVTFTVPADLSVVGDFNLGAWTAVVGDGDPGNDSLFVTISNIPVISSLPYTEGFESGNGGWTSGGNSSTWELGDANNTMIDTANSGVNAWVTNLTGDYVANELSFVESPCFDFSALNVDPVFRFAHIFDTENCCDEGYVDISYDAGTTWARLGAAGEGENWYDDAFNNEWDGTGSTSGGTEWRIAEHLLDSAAGESSVKLRIGFSADGSVQNEGFGFDDINIFEQPAINAGVTEILSPLSGCGLGTELVTVVIENTGDDFLVDFNVEYNIGAGVVTQLVTDTLFSTEIDTITFTVPTDLSTLGSYDFGVWTAVVGDGDPGNDSLFTTISNIPVISGLPYTEDFESGAGGWNTGGAASTWELGEPQGAFIDTANSGVNAWVTNLTGQYAVNELSYIESPCFDFSSLLIDPILEFAHIYTTENCCDEGYVDVSTDAGASWTRLGIAGEGTNWYNDANNNWWDGESGDSTDWRIARHLLDGTAGESSVKVRFGFSSDGSINAEGFGVDDISLIEQPAINSEVTAIVAPATSCGLTATESILVQVSNLGSTVMDSVIIGFSLDNGNPVSEIVNTSIAVGGDATFTLTQTIDLSVPADYTLTVWTATVGDGDMTNDTLSVTVISVPVVSTVPYTEDFESGTGGWVTNGLNSTWELGEPETTFIDTANSGINAWVTNLTGQYSAGEVSYVESPCFDFSSITDDPVLSFAGIFRTESCCDEGWVDISIDGGNTWTKLGASGEGENWYNDAGNNWWDGTSGADNVWVNAEHILDGTAGQAEVKVRFVFSSDGSVQDDGFGVDDISIHPQAQLDLVVLSFDGPTSGCSLGEDAVTFTFWNKGLADASNFEIGFRVDGGLAQTETYTGTVNSGDTVTTTTTVEMVDLSIAGVYSIDVFTALAGDEDVSNDTLFAAMVENFGSSTPMSQSNTTATPIPDSDLNGATSDIFFCGLPSSLDGCLEIESVTIDSLVHNWMSDVDLYLISPAGDTIELSTDNGGAGDNMMNVVFSDTSTNDITLQTTGILPGIYHTEEVDGFASLYDGQNPNGSWSILAIDDLGGFAGTLLGWSMNFVNNSPTPVLNYSDTTICLTQVLTVMSDPYDSYLWSTGNNTQSADLFGNVLGLGTYEVFITVEEDGCSGESNSFTLTVDACAGVAELGALSIDIYPNPSNGQIVVDIAGETEGLNVSILDINGKLIQSEQIGKVTTGVRKTIDLRNVSKGMYFIKLDDGNDAVTQKLVIQ